MLFLHFENLIKEKKKMKKTKLVPLTQFYCDECGGIIENPQDGAVEWEDVPSKNSNTYKYFVRGFRIVHKTFKSPFKENRENGCFKYNGKFRKWGELTSFLEYKNQQLFHFLDLGFMHDPDDEIGCQVTNMKEFVDFAKRLTIPYYEEARRYFQTVLEDGYFGDQNEIGLFLEETLESIIERYAPTLPIEK